MNNVFGKFIRWVLLILFLTSLGLSAESRFRQQYYDGIRIFRSGAKQQAYRHFRDMIKEFPDSLQVKHALGYIDFSREQWKKSNAWYKEILRDKPNDIDALYHSAVCHRELGKFKALVLRKKEWDVSERYFNTIQDSLGFYKDMHLQYAILQKYRQNYREAVELAEVQLEHEKSTDTAVLLHRYYESFVFNAGFEKAHEWLSNRTGKRDSLYLAETFRLEKEYDKAERILSALLQDSLSTESRVPIFLAAAKCKIEQEQSDSCQNYFTQAMDCIKNNLDAELLFENVKYILTDSEYQHWGELKHVVQKSDFFRKVWVKRDPMPASDVNYRITEHMRRFTYAERNFYYDHFRMPFNNPDRLNILIFPKVFDLNEKFNDKGLVFIRHGEPDDRAFVVNGGPLNESWLYYPRGQLNQKMIFHFWQGETQAGQNWRFIAAIPPALAESRSNFDHLYSRMMTADPLEAISLSHQMERMSKEAVRVGMNSDQHSWHKKVRSIIFPFYMATFRDNENYTRSELYFSLTKSDVSQKSFTRDAKDSVTINFAVFNDDYTELNNQKLKVSVQEIIDSTRTMGFWPGQINYIDVESQRLFSLNIRTFDDEAIGGYKFRFNPGDYSGERLSMSSIELAHSIKPSSGARVFVKRDLEVVPNPSKQFKKNDNVFIYFEVYNIKPENRSSAGFYIDYSVKLLEERGGGLLGKVTRLFQKNQPMVSNRVERTTSSLDSFEFLALDLNKHTTGLYELEINVQLADAPESVSRKINFELK